MTDHIKYNQPRDYEVPESNRHYSEEDRIKERIERQQPDPQHEEEEEDRRLVKPSDFHPSNSIDVAHLLLSASHMTSFMPELDKEIKLGNLNQEEKSAIWDFQSVWEDILWLRSQQERRKLEFEKRYGNYTDFNSEDAMMEEIEQETADPNSPSIFDSLATLKKSQRVAVISRGARGFERTQQVSTISTYRSEGQDESEQKPGFLNKLAGGFRR